VLRGEATNTNFIIFGMIQSRLELDWFFFVICILMQYLAIYVSY